MHKIILLSFALGHPKQKTNPIAAKVSGEKFHFSKKMRKSGEYLKGVYAVQLYHNGLLIGQTMKALK